MIGELLKGPLKGVMEGVCLHSQHTGTSRQDALGKTHLAYTYRRKIDRGERGRGRKGKKEIEVSLVKSFTMFIAARTTFDIC